MPGNMGLGKKLQRKVCFHWKTIQNLGIAFCCFFFLPLTSRVKCLGCTDNLIQ